MALALSAAGAFLAPRSPRSIRSSKKDGNPFTRKTARPSRGETAAALAAASPFPYDAGLDVVLYDTTLRDGSQQVGISLTCDDKLAVADNEHFRRVLALPYHRLPRTHGEACCVCKQHFVCLFRIQVYGIAYCLVPLAVLCGAGGAFLPGAASSCGAACGGE